MTLAGRARVFGAALVLMVACAARSVRAQDESRPVASTDISFGISKPITGTWFGRAGSFGLSFLSPTSRRFGNPVVAGIAVTFEGNPASGDVCKLASDGTCLERAPWVNSFNAMVGLDSRPRFSRRMPSVRLLAGPGVYYVREHDAFNSAHVRLGAGARLDLATPPLGAFSLMASVRGSLIAGLDPGRGMIGGSVGLRIH